MDLSATAEPGSTRSLATSEMHSASWNSTIAHTTSVEGPFDVEAMAAAFTALTVRHPALRCRIAVVDGTFSFSVTPDFQPTVEVHVGQPRDRPTDGPIRALVEQERELARLEIVRRRESTVVTLLIHHGIADLAATLAYCRELWANYTGIVEGSFRAGPPVHSLPSPLESVAPGAEFGQARPNPAVRQPDRSAFERPDTVRLTLSERETSGLLRSCRESGVTLHAGLAGLLVAARASGLSRDELLRCASIVNTRRYLPRPLAPTAGTNILGISWADLRVTDGISPIRLGDQIVRKLHADIADGSIWGNNRAAEVNRAPARGVMISNLGSISEVTTPEGVSVTGHSVVGNAIGRRADVNGLQVYQTYGFQGRLFIDSIATAENPSPFTDVRECLEALLHMPKESRT